VALRWLTSVNSTNVFIFGKTDEIALSTVVGKLPGVVTSGSGKTIQFLFSEETVTKISILKEID